MKGMKNERLLEFINRIEQTKHERLFRGNRMVISSIYELAIIIQAISNKQKE